jgi:hypothetical protein
MIKRKLYVAIRKLVLIYLFLFTRKFKFQNLSGLNFKIIDFNNYKKNKNLIFTKNFYQIEKNPIVYNYDFINLCNKS